MAIDVISQIIIVVTTFIIALIICYAFFDNSFNYLMYFETIFLILFVAYNVIDFYYLAVAILLMSVIIYRAIEPEFRKGETKET